MGAVLDNKKRTYTGKDVRWLSWSAIRTGMTDKGQKSRSHRSDV